ncbi:MAG: methyltransferase [Gammaproteobacteria bacterium]|nr:methyltransferase [Gammaproteobacteria bacterium]
MENKKGIPSRLNPSPILALSTGYWNSQALLTANRMGLFALLANESRTLGQIAKGLGSRKKGTRMLLNACIALELVQINNGLYSNTDMSKAFLVPGQQGYLGDAIRYSDDLYQTWGSLEQTLISGIPSMATEKYTGEDLQQTRNFVYGMHNRAMGIGRVMVDLVDLSGRKKMIDVGGGPGTYSSLFAQVYPDIHSRVLDLPAVLEISEEIIESMGVAERVTTEPLDYMQDEFPEGNDVVLISGVFHRETEKTCRGFIRRASQALETGGLLIISDVFSDEGGTSPLFATLFSLNMMLTADDGEVHSDTDVENWMEQENFKDVLKVSFPQPMPHRIVMGIKQ